MFFLYPKNTFAQIIINEISPVSNPEWVELYNNSDENIDITGWKLIDAANSAKTISNIIMNAHEFFVYENPSGWLNNSGQESLFLKNIASDTIDSVVYGTGGVIGIPEVDKSIGRSPDASTNWINNLIWSKGITNLITSTPDPTTSPSITEVPTTTQTSSPTPVKSIYKINKPKDQNGQLITSVKINIDNQYTHHEDDEILEFCGGCFCDVSKSIPCDFGEHTIKLTKSGYSDWSEIRNFSQGNSFEITPILTQLPQETSVTSTPTPTVSIILSKTPTITPTPTFKTIMATFSSTLSAVLGVSTESASISADIFNLSPTAIPEKKISKIKNYKIPFFISLFIAVSSSSLLYFRHQKD